MTYSRIVKSQQELVDLVKDNPGCNSSALVWKRLRGGFSLGRPVGTLNGVTPGDLTAALKIPARASEMVGAGRIERRTGALNKLVPSGSNDGYWAVGAPKTVQRVAAPPAALPSEEKALVDPDAIRRARESLDAFLE